MIIIYLSKKHTVYTNITMIRLTVKIYIVKSDLGTKYTDIFARYNREFVITVNVITKFDCIDCIN
jgi:hypothetical protein